MANYKNIQDDDEFVTIMASARSKLVVVQYYSTRCGPSLEIVPFFSQLARKYPNALFLGVDVDRCTETGARQRLPKFILYRNGTKIERTRSADPIGLEAMVKKHYDGSAGSGFSDLSTYIDMRNSECLNDSDATPFRSFLKQQKRLSSDCDERLMLMYAFTKNVKLHSLKIKADSVTGPKQIKLFINRPDVLDFNIVAGMIPTQEMTLSEEDLSGEKPVELRYVKFQSVNNLQLFVSENQSGSDVTNIDSLTLIGAPVSTTNMQHGQRLTGVRLRKSPVWQFFNEFTLDGMAKASCNLCEMAGSGSRNVGMCPRVDNLSRHLLCIHNIRFDGPEDSVLIPVAAANASISGVPMPRPSINLIDFESEVTSDAEGVLVDLSDEQRVTIPPALILNAGYDDPFGINSNGPSTQSSLTSLIGLRVPPSASTTSSASIFDLLGEVNTSTTGKRPLNSDLPSTLFNAEPLETPISSGMCEQSTQVTPQQARLIQWKKANHVPDFVLTVNPKSFSKKLPPAPGCATGTGPASTKVKPTAKIMLPPRTLRPVQPVAPPSIRNKVETNASVPSTQPVTNS